MIKKKINQRGQFFSPDLIIAMSVFIFTMALFWVASNFVFTQTEVISERVNSDEVTHTIFNSLLFSSGYPIDWEKKELSEIEVIGLVHSNNFVDENKLVTLINSLNSTTEEEYYLVKSLLGAKEFDLELSLTDFQEKVITKSIELKGGRVSSNPVTKNISIRLIHFNGEEFLLKMVLSKSD